MSKPLCIRLDSRLAAALNVHARGRGLKPSQAARDLIRRGLALVDSERDAGFEEGRIEGRAQLFAALNDFEGRET